MRSALNWSHIVNDKKLGGSWIYQVSLQICQALLQAQVA